MKVLIVFLFDSHYNDFCFAELDGLLQLNHLDPATVYTKPIKATHTATDTTTTNAEEQFNSQSWATTHREKSKNQFLVAELPNDEVVKSIMERAVLIRGIYELYSSPQQDVLAVIDEVNRSIAPSTSSSTTAIDNDKVSPIYKHAIKQTTWSLTLEAFFKSLTQPTKQLFREQFTCFNNNDAFGAVDLVNPTLKLSLLLDYSQQPQDEELQSENNNNNNNNNNNKPATQLATSLTSHVSAYFGRLICDNTHMKLLQQQYDLKYRPYLGPTSLDHSLAFLLMNIATVNSNHLVLDPFVGTGSILVAASCFGGLTFGSDIDVRILRGTSLATTVVDLTTITTTTTVGANGETTITKNQYKRPPPTKQTKQQQQQQQQQQQKPPNIFTNFDYYKLPHPELLRLDNHLVDRHYNLIDSIHNNNNNNNNKGGEATTRTTTRTMEGMFDAIVTDPPYGIRAGAKKSGMKQQQQQQQGEERGEGGVSTTVTTTGNSQQIIVTTTTTDNNNNNNNNNNPPSSSSSLLLFDRAQHVPRVSAYDVGEVLLDLLHSAATTLALGGRLLYLLPTSYDFSELDLPAHPCLQLISICEQPLSSRHCRRAVLMIKHKLLTEEDERVFREYKHAIMSGEQNNSNNNENTDANSNSNSNNNNNNNNSGFGKLMFKLQRALAANAYLDETVVKRASHGCVKRKETLAAKAKIREERIAADPTFVPTKKNKNKNKGHNNNSNNKDNNKDSTAAPTKSTTTPTTTATTPATVSFVEKEKQIPVLSTAKPIEVTTTTTTTTESSVAFAIVASTSLFAVALVASLLRRS